MHLRSSFRSAACSTGHVPEVGGGGVNTYQLGLADVEQVQLQRLVQLQAGDQPLHTAPSRFHRLEARRVQQLPHLLGDGLVDRRRQRRLLRAMVGQHVRRNDAADEGVHTAWRGSGLPFTLPSALAISLATCVTDRLVSDANSGIVNPPWR